MLANVEATGLAYTEPSHYLFTTESACCFFVPFFTVPDSRAGKLCIFNVLLVVFSYGRIDVLPSIKGFQTSFELALRNKTNNQKRLFSCEPVLMSQVV